MKTENKKCWSCASFQNYYTKGYCKFTKEKVGYCSSREKIVDKNECCERWNYRQRFRARRKDVAISSIADVRDKLEVIEQILTEENELDKIHDEKDD